MAHNQRGRCNVRLCRSPPGPTPSAGGTFCAGDDLHHSDEERFEFGQPDLHTRLRTGYPRLLIDIMTLRKPVVAMVQGYAYGGGFDIALACDFRYVSKKAKFAAAYIKRGMGGGCVYLLPRYVGLGKATERIQIAQAVKVIMGGVDPNRLPEPEPSDSDPSEDTP